VAKPQSKSGGRKEQHVCHEQAAATIAIGERSEDECTEWTHGQRAGDGENDVGLADVEFVREHIEEKDQYEEVEGVERPTEKGGEDRVPAVGGGRDVGCRRGSHIRRPRQEKLPDEEL